jgi:hypothetical protein
MGTALCLLTVGLAVVDDDVDDGGAERKSRAVASISLNRCRRCPRT